MHPVSVVKTLEFILVPVDGTAPSLAALEHAAALARDYAARIHVLQIVQARDPLAASARAELDRATDSAVERAELELGHSVARSTVAAEDPVRAIVEQASEGGADLVVMGTHGRPGRMHALLGSVAEGVIRNAPCPVMTVRDPSGGYQSFAERRHGRPTLAEQASPAHAVVRGR